jgi:hydroxypyruvate reductase
MQTALQRVEGRSCVRAALAAKGLAAPVWVAAVGKAATAMALGAHDALGSAIERTLIITRDAQPLSDFPAGARPEVCFGAHPVPDERSLKAGARLVEWVDTLPAHVQVLFLISGGASALVEVLRPGKTLRDLEALTREALASGIDINELNARRGALSDIKGGRLAARLHGRPARALFISDVPHDDPRVIGSGLMGPAPGAPDQIERQVVASIEQALEALVAQGVQLGLRVHAPPARFEGEAVRLAARFAHELRLTSAQLCAWGGESTVRLPAQPGSGGRNQHLALAAARLIAGHADLLLLAAGTDGSDGVTEDAGALVDGDTWARITLAEIDADACIRQADSARALAGSGDLVHTGPTGTNVGDLVIGLKLALADAHTVTQPHGGAPTRVL